MTRKALNTTVAFLMSVACAFGLVACGEGPQITEQPIDVDLDRNIEAKLVAVVPMSALEQSLLTKAAEGFKTVYPNVEVEVVQSNDFSTYIRSGDQADIVHLIGEDVSFYASQNILAELDPYMEAQKFDTSLYYESMINLGKDSVSKKQYMMARDYSRIVCYYNKDMFDDLGVAYPRDTAENPWTWEAFLETCAAVKSAMAGNSAYTNYVPVQASMSYDILNWGVVSSFGVECLLNDDYTLVDKTSTTYKQWQSGIELARSMITNGYSLGSNGYSATDFQTGKAAMSLAAAPAATAYKQGEINYDLISFPAIGDNPKAPSGTSGYAISNYSQNKNVAWAFLNYLMSEDGQNKITDGTSLVPVLTSLAEDEDAIWRNVTNGKGQPVNSAALLSYSERDVIADWFGDLPALARVAYKGYYNTFMRDTCNGTKSFLQAYQVLQNALTDYKKLYPEYFA